MGKGHVGHQNVQEKLRGEKLRISEILNINCINFILHMTWPKAPILFYLIDKISQKHTKKENHLD